MKFYTQTHHYFCGIDLHTKTMYLCILDPSGEVVLHTNIPAKPKPFLKAIKPLRDDLVVGVECMFSWYWLANVCLRENSPFILGHALYMKAIHGGKAKSDKIDSEKIARLIKGGTFPLAYVYPPERRPVRDLLRRRRMLVRHRSEVVGHIKITHHQYNAEFFQKNINKQGNRDGIAEQFSDPTIRKNIEVDLSVADHLHTEIVQLGNYLVRQAKAFDPRTYFRLQTVPGIGQVLALTLLYEIGEIERFATVQAFCSYARLVKCSKESAGKRYGTSGAKIGNVHLRWALGEAACLFLRNNPKGQKLHQRLVKKHGKAKALSVLSQKLGRAVYFMLKRQQAFNMNKFLNS